MSTLQCLAARSFTPFKSEQPARPGPLEIRRIAPRMPAQLALRRPAPVKAQAADVAETKPAKKKATKAPQEEGAKKTRKKKDKDEPKRGLSAFMHFSQANRDKIRKENPDLAITQVAKVLGERWALVSPADRKPFEEQAAADKQRYEKELAAYKAQKGV